MTQRGGSHTQQRNMSQPVGTIYDEVNAGPMYAGHNSELIRSEHSGQGMPEVNGDADTNRVSDDQQNTSEQPKWRSKFENRDTEMHISQSRPEMQSQVIPESMSCELASQDKWIENIPLQKWSEQFVTEMGGKADTRQPPDETSRRDGTSGRISRFSKLVRRSTRATTGGERTMQTLTVDDIDGQCMVAAGMDFTDGSNYTGRMNNSAREPNAGSASYVEGTKYPKRLQRMAQLSYRDMRT